MPGFQAVPNVMKAEMPYQVAGQTCLNTFHFLRATPATTTDCQNLATAMRDTYWIANLRPLVTADYFSNGCFVAALDSPSAPFYGLDFVSTVQNGTASGMSVPSGSTLVSTFKTAERSRNGRGRVYISGVPAPQLSDPIEVANSYLTSFITAMSSLLTIATAISATLVVVSRVLAGIPRTTGVPIAVTSVTADRYLDSQRRRLFGRGV